jgi:hypothetical protein
MMKMQGGAKPLFAEAATNMPRVQRHGESPVRGEIYVEYRAIKS